MCVLFVYSFYLFLIKKSNKLHKIVADYFSTSNSFSLSLFYFYFLFQNTNFQFSFNLIIPLTMVTNLIELTMVYLCSQGVREQNTKRQSKPIPLPALSLIPSLIVCTSVLESKKAFLFPIPYCF